MSCLCGYISEDKSNFKRHQKSCKHTIKRKYDDLLRVHDTTLEELNETKRELCSKQKELQEVIDTVKQLKKKTTTIKDCNICIVNNIYPHSREPAIISPTIIEQLLQSPTESVPNFIQLKHFVGPLSARNIQLPNIRGNTVKVVAETNTGLRWVHRDRKEFVDDLFERNLDELRTNYNAERVQAWKEWYRSTGLHGLHARETTTWKEQLCKLDLLLVNHQRCQRPDLRHLASERAVTETSNDA
jgi:hypothetical protein